MVGLAHCNSPVADTTRFIDAKTLRYIYKRALDYATGTASPNSIRSALQDAETLDVPAATGSKTGVGFFLQYAATSTSPVWYELGSFTGSAVTPHPPQNPS